jgi:hypothetical protein
LGREYGTTEGQSSNPLVRHSRRCCQVSSAEARAINTVLEGNAIPHDEEAHPCWQPIPRAAGEVSSILASVSPTLDDQVLYGRLAERADLGKFKASIRSMDVLGGQYLIDDDSATQTSTDEDMIESDSEDEDEDQALNDLYDRATKVEIDLDAIMGGHCRSCWEIKRSRSSAFV